MIDDGWSLPPGAGASSCRAKGSRGGCGLPGGGDERGRCPRACCLPAEPGAAVGSLRALGTPLPSQRAGRAGRSLGQSPDFLNLNIALRFGDGAGEPTCAGGFVYSLVGNLLFLRMAAFCFILWSWVCLLVCRCRKKMYRIYKNKTKKLPLPVKFAEPLLVITQGQKTPESSYVAEEMSRAGGCGAMTGANPARKRRGSARPLCPSGSIISLLPPSRHPPHIPPRAPLPH